MLRSDGESTSGREVEEAAADADELAGVDDQLEERIATVTERRETTSPLLLAAFALLVIGAGAAFVRTGRFARATVDFSKNDVIVHREVAVRRERRTTVRSPR